MDYVIKFLLYAYFHFWRLSCFENHPFNQSQMLIKPIVFKHTCKYEDLRWLVLYNNSNEASHFFLNLKIESIINTDQHCTDKVICAFFLISQCFFLLFFLCITLCRITSCLILFFRFSVFSLMFNIYSQCFLWIAIIFA